MAERLLTIAAMLGLGAWITQVIAANGEPITQPLPIDGRGPVIARIARVPFDAAQEKESMTCPSSPNEDSITDGAELTLFVWREFCERPDPPTAPGMTVAATISHLREAFA
jgi:hypothetical protein